MSSREENQARSALSIWYLENIADVFGELVHIILSKIDITN
jgi:hypothetical protein